MNDAQLLLQTYVLIDVETVKVCFKMFSQGQKLDVIYEKKSWLVGLSMHNWNVHWKLNINFNRKAFLKHLIQYLSFFLLNIWSID